MRSNDFGKKPDNTKIQITRGGDCFEVYVPPIEFHHVILFLVPFIIPWLSFINVWISMAAQASSPVNISLLMCLLPVGAAICLLAQSNVLDRSSHRKIKDL